MCAARCGVRRKYWCAKRAHWLITDGEWWWTEPSIAVDTLEDLAYHRWLDNLIERLERLLPVPCQPPQ